MLGPATSSAGRDSLIDFVSRAANAGVDLIQIRERDLSARNLFYITEAAADAARRAGARVLVNDRADIAASCGAGVHLTTRSMTADVVRRAFGDGVLIGASTHNAEEAREAASAGTDFIVFGPVFETESKKEYGPPAGLDALRDVSVRLKIPVLALGGINDHNFKDALDAGASGIAAISLFARADDLAGLVQKIKSYVKR
jgi:thiamine-phosphate pyrophosphorylase